MVAMTAKLDVDLHLRDRNGDIVKTRSMQDDCPRVQS
jgi:hypothetical protein